MTVYEFPPKGQSTEDVTSTPEPMSVRARLVNALQWSLYSVIALLVAGYVAVQTNPGVATYLAAVPGLGATPAKSCPLRSCSLEGAGHCCARDVSACVAKCIEEQQAEELKTEEQQTEEIASPPSPPQPEILPVEDQNATL